MGNSKTQPATLLICTFWSVFCKRNIAKNQLRVNQNVMTSSASDFQIGNRTFEVGGKNKKQKQLQGVGHGFVVKDDIETEYLNVIPLWNFGLNC